MPLRDVVEEVLDAVLDEHAGYSMLKQGEEVLVSLWLRNPEDYQEPDKRRHLEELAAAAGRELTQRGHVVIFDTNDPSNSGAIRMHVE